MKTLIVLFAALSAAVPSVCAASAEREFYASFIRQVDGRQSLLNEHIVKKKTELAQAKFDLSGLEISAEVWTLTDFRKKIDEKRKAIADLEKDLETLLQISSRNLRLKRELADELAKAK